MTGNQAIAKILKAEGLDWFACFPHHSLIDAAAKEGLRPILTRQERAGVNMADGYSRIMCGNRIGMFMMQDGPGAENAFGGVAQAYADSVPILLLPGGPGLSGMWECTRASFHTVTTVGSLSGQSTLIRRTASLN